MREHCVKLSYEGRHMRDGRRSLGRASLWCSALLMIAIGAIVLLIPAFINGFPLVYEDSVDYLIFTPRLYRSPFYGIFLFLFHWNRFIWVPIFAQALIVDAVAGFVQRAS